MKTIIRNLLSVLRRFKMATLLNVLGLSIAFAAFMVIMMQVDYDRNFDKFHKEANRIYRLENGLRLECSRVDPGTDTEFYYAEVEFQDQQQAEIFSPPDFLGKEVTYDGSYRMKAYYQRKK